MILHKQNQFHLMRPFNKTSSSQKSKHRAAGAGAAVAVVIALCNFHIK